MFIPTFSMKSSSDFSLSPEESSKIISDTLSSDKPCLICRFGSTELSAYQNYRKGHPLSFLRKKHPFWVDSSVRNEMEQNAGFYPSSHSNLARFADIIDSCINEIDVLASWIKSEDSIRRLNKCKKIPLLFLEPHWSATPWSKLLANKKVLVIHPFSESIISQYERRSLLFDNKDILPEFKKLTIIKAIQLSDLLEKKFPDWFSALDYMQKEIDKTDFEIALIGCGAYGMPLAAYCKRLGKQAIHMGGALQLLFGIWGARWEDPTYSKIPHYQNLRNEYWIRPSAKETPNYAKLIENGCYW